MSGRILIVDDHEAVRRGLRSLLSSRPEWTICGEATDGIDGVEKAKALSPDLILMDISMPRMDGLEATRRILKDLPAAKVIIVSQNDPAVASRQAREVKAVAYIAKSNLSQQLLPTISRILDGHIGEDASEEAKKAKQRSSSSTPDWLAGAGELGELIRKFDWSKTPLGPLENWPQSLKTSVNLILNSQHPMWLGWGPACTFLYNDAYIQVLSSAKHPWALGKPAKEVWAEIWDICGPLADKVFEKGEASFVDEVRLFMKRGDFFEETYYSFSYSPIRDESGMVAGLFCPSTEVTPKVINARRLRTLSELSATALIQKTVESACESAIATLAKNPDDIPFEILYLVEEGGKTARLKQVHGLPENQKAALAPESIDLTAEGRANCIWPIADAFSSHQSQQFSVKDVPGLPLGLANQRLSEVMILPVATSAEAESAAVLIAGVNPTGKLDTEYRTFYELVTGQIATAIQNARFAEDGKKRMEALAEIDRAKTAFFSNVSHEFRTPLTLMLGPVEELLARSHTDLTPAAKSQLELVNRNGSRLLRLVNTLLDFSRIEAGRMQAVYQPTDLAAFTVELASVFRSATEKAGLKLELDCPHLAEPVFVDRGMWEKIVLNLISNAFKFTFEGQISVSLKQVDHHVELRVRDSGVGISANELPRLFDRFHRIENSRSRTHEGSGIGLALVQELVKLHAGSVRVESTPGEGSTFIVSVPLGHAHLPADRIGGTRSLASTALGAAPFVDEAIRWLPESENQTEEEILPADELLPVPCPPLAAGDATSEKRPFIVIADDNADMRQYLLRLLGERYEVQGAPDGRAALQLIRERSPDLVLSDVMMPNLDGFGLLRELRNDEKNRTVPIILLSARAGEESRVEGMEQGADDYLIKPFSARELLARVQTHLQMARVRKQGEEALRRRTDQFETLLSAAPLGVFLVDDSLLFRELNPTARGVFEDAGDLIGRSYEEIIRGRWPKEHADEIVGRFRHTLETGESYSTSEWIRQRRDGDARYHYEWQINRIPLPDGRYGVVCYFRDISRQVHAREAIAASEKRLRLATEAAQLGIWHWYPEGDRATWDNDRMYEIFGRPKEQGPFGEAEFRRSFAHSEDIARLHEGLLATLNTGARLFQEGRVYRTDGACRWLEFTGQLERKPDGSPLSIMGTVLDITERKHNELTLRRHRERFDLVARAAQVGFWFCDLPFDKLIWDDQVKEHFWLPPDAEVTIGTFYERIHQDDRERTRLAIEKSIANDTPYDIEYRTVSGDGRIKWVRATGRTFYDDKRQPTRFDGLTLDITARKQAEQATLESEERLRIAQRAARSGTWENNFDTNRLISSPELMEIFGLDASTASEDQAQWRGMIFPEDLVSIDKAVADAISVRGPEFRGEFRLTRPDHAIRWIETTARIFYHENGKPSRIVGVSVDITERKRAEERERQITAEAISATAKFRAIFEQTPVFAGIMALDGRVIDANRLSLQACGYRPDEVLGKSFWQTPWWRKSEEVQKKIRTASEQAAQGIPSRETLSYWWSDGSERLLDFALHPILDQDGKILFLHPTGVDITDLKRAEENYRRLAETLDAEVRSRTSELEQRNIEVLRQSELLRHFSQRLLQAQDEERRRIARELHDSSGQLLAALSMSLAKLAQQTREGGSEIAKSMDESQQLVRQLSQEIRTMSYLLHPPLLDEIGLSEAVRWYIQGLTERSGLDIKLELSDNFGRLSREMELVMFRLVQECLTNIHRHSGSKSAIIRMQRENGHLSLEVADAGKGIPAGKLSQIQAHGSGVGIRGMNERVRQFNGQMAIESNGEGTRIRFEFPLPTGHNLEDGNKEEEASGITV